MARALSGSSLRGIKIAARSFYRELRSAGYHRAEMVRFANAFLEHVLANADLEAPRLAHAETGLVAEEAFIEILEFHRRRAVETGASQSLALLALQAHFDPDLTTDLASLILVDLANIIRDCTRREDVAGQLGNGLLVAALPGCHAPGLRRVIARIRQRIQETPEIAQHQQQGRVGLSVHSVNWDGNDTSAEELLQRLSTTRSESIEFDGAAPLVTRPRSKKSSTPPGANLVLCGGAVRGLAHIGALSVLSTSGLRIRGVVGTGMGGVVGAMFCRGMPPSEIQDRLLSFLRSSSLHRIQRDFVKYRLRANRGENLGAFRNHQLSLLSTSDTSSTGDSMYNSMIETLVGSDMSISDLPLPFATAATDLVEGRSVILSHGSLHSALRATLAVPGLFPPEVWGKRLLIDGSALSEAPLSAVHVLPKDYPTIVIYLRRPIQQITEFENSQQIAARLNALVHRELVREQLRPATTIVSIPVEEFGSFAASAAEQLIYVGEATMRSELSRVLSSLEG